MLEDVCNEFKHTVSKYTNPRNYAEERYMQKMTENIKDALYCGLKFNCDYIPEDFEGDRNEMLTTFVSILTSHDDSDNKISAMNDMWERHVEHYAENYADELTSHYIGYNEKKRG